MTSFARLGDDLHRRNRRATSSTFTEAVATSALAHYASQLVGDTVNRDERQHLIHLLNNVRNAMGPGSKALRRLVNAFQNLLDNPHHHPLPNQVAPPVARAVVVGEVPLVVAAPAVQPQPQPIIIPREALIARVRERAVGGRNVKLEQYLTKYETSVGVAAREPAARAARTRWLTKATKATDDLRQAVCDLLGEPSPIVVVGVMPPQAPPIPVQQAVAAAPLVVPPPPPPPLQRQQPQPQPAVAVLINDLTNWHQKATRARHQLRHAVAQLIQNLQVGGGGGGGGGGATLNSLHAVTAVSVGGRNRALQLILDRHMTSKGLKKDLNHIKAKIEELIKKHPLSHSYIAKELTEYIDTHHPTIQALNKTERRLVEQSPTGRTDGEGFESLLAEGLMNKNESLKVEAVGAEDFAAYIEKMRKRTEAIIKPSEQHGLGLDLIKIRKKDIKFELEYIQLKMGNTPIGCGAAEAPKFCSSMIAQKENYESKIRDKVSINSSKLVLYTTRTLRKDAQDRFKTDRISVVNKTQLWALWPQRIRKYVQDVLDLDQKWLQPE